jgi:glucosamine--fructose-6-phosphate aminotransferase (isomerizing)
MWDEKALACAKRHQEDRGFLFLGRGIHYAVAREGGLKLKEISQVHAEGLPSGELRHGSNALVDENLSVIALATRDTNDPDSMLRYHKTVNVIEYVKSRGGKVLAIVTEGDDTIHRITDQVIAVPEAPELITPLLEVVPLQLFAHHFGLLNGCNVDHPRNLVKAVVTE